MTPTIATHHELASGSLTPLDDARAWLAHPDERHVAELEGFEAWRARMHARWDSVLRLCAGNGDTLRWLRFRVRLEACEKAWSEAGIGGGAR